MYSLFGLGNVSIKLFNFGIFGKKFTSFISSSVSENLIHRSTKVKFFQLSFQAQPWGHNGLQFNLVR